MQLIALLAIFAVLALIGVSSTPPSDYRNDEWDGHKLIVGRGGQMLHHPDCQCHAWFKVDTAEKR